MSELSFYEEGDPDMFLDPAPALPRQIVLELGKHFSEFKEQSEKGELLGFDTEVQLAEILQEIAIQKDAEHNLNVTHHVYMSDCADTEFATEVAEFIEARIKFCNFLLKEIELFRLYFNGYLFYTYGKLIGTKLVLEKISVAIEERDRLARTIANQADFAFKHSVKGITAEAKEPSKPKAAGA